MSVLRFIVSTKTTITLLLALGIVGTCSIFNPLLPSYLDSLKLDLGFQSWPFLGLLGALSINQFGSIIVRIKQSFQRKKDPFFQAVHDEEDDFFAEENDDIEKKKGLPHPAPMAKNEGKIETLLPAKNAESLLTVLGFRNFFSAEDSSSAEKITAQKGGRTGLYTLLIHLGIMCILGGFLLLLGVSPTRHIKLKLKKNVELGGNLKPPLYQLLKQIGLLQTSVTTTPKHRVLVERLNFQYKDAVIRQRKSDQIERIQTDIHNVFFAPKKVKLLRLDHKIPYHATVNLKIDDKSIRLGRGSNQNVGTYKLTFSHTELTATFSVNGKKITVKTGEKKKIGNHKLEVHLVSPSTATAESCLFVRIYDSKKSSVSCLSQGTTKSLGQTKLKVLHFEQKVILRYQSKNSFFLLYTGLFLFLFGFIGFWWPPRYRVFLTWRRSKNDIIVESSGIGIFPKKMIYLIEKTLFFPAEWIGSPQKKKEATKSVPLVGVTTAKQQLPPVPPAPRQQVPTPRQQVPTPRQQVPTPRQQVPAFKQQVPASKQQVPASKQQVPAPKKHIAKGNQKTVNSEKVKPIPVNIIQKETRITTPQPSIKMVQPNTLVPESKNSDPDLDLDSLFQDLQTTPSKSNTKSNPSATPGDFNELDIDALFQDFENKVDSKKK